MIVYMFTKYYYIYKAIPQIYMINRILIKENKSQILHNITSAFSKQAQTCTLHTVEHALV